MDKKDLKNRLSDMQYKVTQEEGTEPPFKNAYWDNKAHGIYVDVVSGEPLFSSTHKYDSKTGWPSFWETLAPQNIVQKKDFRLFYQRVEVRSKNADSHLGHLFTDGPQPTGLRYCINSAALRFVPQEKMAQEGYSEFLPLFTSETSGAVKEVRLAKAMFAGGCFWCVEADFDKIKGVKSTTSGYTGGRIVNPTYEQVSQGITGHTEAVLVEYDPQQISYKDLLEVFWLTIDPTTQNRQFCDTGDQYRSGIYPFDEEQMKIAQQSRLQLKNNKNLTQVFTEIKTAEKFYTAEDYHQDYYRKNPIKYKYYRYRCGRDQRLKELWGKHRQEVFSRHSLPQ